MAGLRYWKRSGCPDRPPRRGSPRRSAFKFKGGARTASRRRRRWCIHREPKSQINYAGYIWLTEGFTVGQRRSMSSTLPSSWEDYAKALGIELQRQRINASLTQENLAHRAGITRTHYQQLERGYWRQDAPSNPSVKLLARLAQALRVDIGSLLPPVAALEWPEQ
jgi:DNA-binding XRE family transcriptional regulator